MTAKALINARVLLPEGLRRDVVVTIADGRIRAVSPEPDTDAEPIDCAGGLLLPGFIDTQVNGGGGALFNDDPTVATIATIAAAHRRFGTTALLPTLVSDRRAVIARAVAAVDEAIAAGVPGIAGIHIEGPFLAMTRRGIHDPARIDQIDDAAIALLSSATRGRTLVTVAPECVRPGDIARLVAAGVIVAGGHSEASYEQVRAALDEGMTGFTHLFNAMSPWGSRAPGMVGAALEDEASIAGLIVDGEHLHAATVRLALRIKGATRLMLVSDAMPCAGSDADSFLLQGRVIRRVGDRVVGADGTLAGSTLTMNRAVATLIAQTGSDLATAVPMASAVPAAFLGLGDRRGAIVAGFDADLILADEALVVQRSWIGGGEVRYDRAMA
ncbi:N-acetylglucosamine-6-phosphate deacetylase [uncultured Sphingomonas sp.]|uniref:N-acetylglucosamine-6-phosphate deacetylase n=1 Tax=uncultured Sphingomonas sp. TaxID=158754 RepID=UPI002625918F|nr:N-acetylglucosamine-6-phosphate deacetylase [uncultured Sphingomonas sp.]